MHYHGEAGVEVVMDVFHSYSIKSCWEKCWKPNRLCRPRTVDQLQS